MFLGKNNIIVKIENKNSNDEYAILNPISGSFDIMNNQEYQNYLKIKNNETTDNEFLDYLIERGYLYNSKKEHDDAIKDAYDEFNKEIKNSQVQLMLIPTYGCNLGCTYCFQHGIDQEIVIITKEVVDKFFEYANNNFNNLNKKPFITLFGGEPLINSDKQRNIIKYIVDMCKEYDYELSVVTNGYDLKEFVSILKEAKIKEIQVTLDGTKEIHDNRRHTKNKKGTFEKIIEGIDMAVKESISINLRSVVDKENMDNIVKLASYLDEKGWLDLPVELFKTQIGRNYELFECYDKSENLMEQAELWAQYSKLGKENPVLLKLHRPDFKGIRHIVDTGEMYMASFDTCPAVKTEWVFDLHGEIYGCTASCGRKEYKLGDFWPEVKLNQEEINKWKKRDVVNIKECNDCAYDVICGGGCGVIAGNKNNLDILKPDCRPIQSILEVGIKHYKDEIDNLSYENQSEDLSHEKKGCVICGTDLIYKNISVKEKCEICGYFHDSNAVCKEGHFVCDSCHLGGILEKVKEILIESKEKDPVTLSNKIFDIPNLKMHGPEYHSIVPAVLVTAWANNNPNKNNKVEVILEAIRRGKDIKGGSCGFNGACGAGIGIGIAKSIIDDVTPYSKEERGKANYLTAKALMAISKYNGPRCCKRDSISAIESFVEETDFFDGIKNGVYECNQFKFNKECVGIKCNYYPK